MGAIEADLHNAEHELSSVRRRAEAARLLHEVFQDERAIAHRAYVAPLRSKIESLGRHVFGASLQIELDDQLRIIGRVLDGQRIPYESLSGGAREQLGIITRLACAMTVAPDGGVPVILDDALGYSDPQRLDEMGAVLSVAARDCQIIILTCVPDRYRRVGAARVVALS
jgi:hypothetical protein